MTAVSYLGVFLSLIAISFASNRMTLRKFSFAAALLIIHISTSVLSYVYAKAHISDSSMYYYDTYHFADQPWSSVGTVFVIHITQLLKNYLGASYFDSYIIFQMIGYWGLIILLRTFEEIQAKVGVNESLIAGYLLCLPTLHYWTSNVGKDGILLFALALCTWSALRFSTRFIQFFIAVLIMTLVRAHIALIVVASLMLAAAAYRGLSLGRRIIMIVPALGALVVLAGVVQNYLGVDVANAGSVASFLEERTALSISAQGSTNLSGDSFVVRLFSLLFRPMFYDARNALGIIASLENCVLLFIVGYCVVHYRQLLEMYRKVLFARFAVFLFLVLTVLLATVNYNVGLGLRQRTMMLPPLLSMFVAIWAYRKRLRSAGRPMAATDLSLLQQSRTPLPATTVKKGVQA